MSRPTSWNGVMVLSAPNGTAGLNGAIELVATKDGATLAIGRMGDGPIGDLTMVDRHEVTLPAEVADAILEAIWQTAQTPRTETGGPRS
jgi:hypothetical protein